MALKRCVATPRGVGWVSLLGRLSAVVRLSHLAIASLDDQSMVCARVSGREVGGGFEGWRICPQKTQHPIPDRGQP